MMRFFTFGLLLAVLTGSAQSYANLKEPLANARIEIEDPQESAGRQVTARIKFRWEGFADRYDWEVQANDTIGGRSTWMTEGSARSLNTEEYVWEYTIRDRIPDKIFSWRVTAYDRQNPRGEASGTRNFMFVKKPKSSAGASGRASGTNGATATLNRPPSFGMLALVVSAVCASAIATFHW